jgi:hypothetical protein
LEISVPNYTERHGDCSGNDIKKITKAKLPKCRVECEKLAKCVTFLFVDQGANSYCWLKDNKCPKLTATNHKEYYFFNKSKLMESFYILVSFNLVTTPPTILRIRPFSLSAIL